MGEILESDVKLSDSLQKMNVDFMHYDVDLDLSTIIYHASHSSSSYHSTDSNLIMIV